MKQMSSLILPTHFCINCKIFFLKVFIIIFLFMKLLALFACLDIHSLKKKKKKKLSIIWSFPNNAMLLLTTPVIPILSSNQANPSWYLCSNRPPYHQITAIVHMDIIHLIKYSPSTYWVIHTMLALREQQRTWQAHVLSSQILYFVTTI